MTETPEQQSRQTIDQQLAQCGWIVRNADAMNPTAGLGVAIADDLQTALDQFQAIAGELAE